MKRIGLLDALVIVLMGCAVMEPESDTGVVEGRFKPCPPYPRCASTQSRNSSQFIEPLSFNGDPAVIMERVRKVMNGMERGRLIEAHENYLHFEFRTRLLRFVDDVETYTDPANKKVHFRSSSRMGYYDFKTNRHRIEEIKRRILEQIRIEK